MLAPLDGSHRPVTEDNAARLLQQLTLNPATRDHAPRWRGWLLALLIAGSGAAGWWYWSRPVVLAVRTATAEPLATAAPADQAVLDATGYVTARRQATVSAKVTGRVAEVLIEEGQRVAAGEVLARLDPIDADAQHALAQSQLAAASAELDDLRLQRTQAERDAERAEALVARKLTSTQSVEDARLRVTTLGARLHAQDRRVEVAKRGLELAEVALDNTIIRAPFDGVVTVKAAQPGEIVSPMSAGGGFTRTGIGTIVDMDSLEIEVDVNESYISRVHPGQAITANLNAYPDWDIPAHVITIIPTADRAKATVKVRIALDVKDTRIVPEMGVRVGFLEQRAGDGAAPARQPGVLVPASAIGSEGDRSVAFVIDGEHARRRELELGQQFGGNRQVLRGLTAGDRVILSPAPGLTDGARVRAANEGATP
jgi:RND family efflux transporter MFP subunit